MSHWGRSWHAWKRPFWRACAGTYCYLPVHQHFVPGLWGRRLPSACPPCRQGETRRANLDMLVEKAIAYEATFPKGPVPFYRYIEAQKYDTDFGERQMSPASRRTREVQIMSIHRAGAWNSRWCFCWPGSGRHFNKRAGRLRGRAGRRPWAGSGLSGLKTAPENADAEKQALRRRMGLEGNPWARNCVICVV